MAMPAPDIERHPDVAVMRRRYDEIAERPMIQSVDGLTFLSGLYLAMSPWVLGFTEHSSMTASNLFTGLAIAVLAVGFAATYGHLHGIAWVAAVLAAWAIVSPWVVSGPTPDNGTIVSNIIVGAVCLVCTLALVGTSMRRPTP
jgi:hypothetical protein